MISIETLEQRAAELAELTLALASDLEDAMHNHTNNADVNSICRVLLASRVVKDAMDAPVKIIGKHNTLLKQVIVPKIFGDTDSTTLTAFGHRFSVSTKLSASFPDKEAGHKWLEDNKLGDIIKPTVNAQTLSSTAKSLIEEGLELDPEIFNVNYVEASHCHAVEHYNSKLVVMRRLNYHGRNFLSCIHAIDFNLSSHNAVQPVSSSKNYAYNIDNPLRVRSENSVVNA